MRDSAVIFFVTRLLLALLLVSSALLADEWPAARRVEVFSENGERFVRITPGESIGDTFGFAGGKKGRYARAELFERAKDRSFRLVWEIDLLNPIAPVDVLLSDSGGLITFDNWHNAGYGKVVAVYEPDGKLLRTYELEELYGEEGLAQVWSSVSSRWWRCKPQGWSDPDAQTRVFVHEAGGGYFVFDMTDGSKRYEAGSSPCAR